MNLSNDEANELYEEINYLKKLIITSDKETRELQKEIFNLKMKIKELEKNKSIITKLADPKLCDHRYEYSNDYTCKLCGFISKQ